MLKQTTVGLATSILLFSCSSNKDTESDKLTSLINTSLENDKRIDQDEFKRITELLDASDDKSISHLKDDEGNIINKKLKEYIVKLAKNNKINISHDDIDSNLDIHQKEFSVNIYIENSASMNGYVTGATQFESSIYNLIGDLKLTPDVSSINLNYINNSIPFSKKNASINDIKEFIEDLDPKTFAAKGGDQSSSNIENIIKRVVNEVDNNNVGVLVSDFIFSPGGQVDAKDYLTNQSIAIKHTFVEALQKHNLSVIFLQLKSQFNGRYYNKFDAPVSLQADRPYYIMIVGTHNHINKINNSNIVENIKGGYLNKVYWDRNISNQETDYKIISRPIYGKFKTNEIKQKIISEIEKQSEGNHKGKFGFKIAANFNGTLRNSDYYLDSLNYKINNPNYTLSINKISDTNNESLKGYTHLIELVTTSPKEEKLIIDILPRTPNWIEEYSSIDDTKIVTDQLEKTKTFGLSYLIEGISDAFYPKNQPNSLHSFTVTLKK